MAKRLGFIAEDISDIEVLKILTKKLTSKPFAVSHFVGKGCGPLAKKSPGWCRVLLIKECHHVVLVHDLDRNNLVQLRQKLEGILLGAPQRTKSVVIPIEELEAWLLSDEQAIAKALNLDKVPALVHHPEGIPSPKEYIGDMVRKISNKQKQYVNTVHNRLIAGSLDIAKLRKKCPSFKKFEEFVQSAV